MNKGLKDYLKKCNAKPLDPAIMENYLKEMEEQTIPKIIEEMKRDRELIEELYFPTPRTPRIKKNATSHPRLHA